MFTAIRFIIRFANVSLILYTYAVCLSVVFKLVRLIAFEIVKVLKKFIK